MNPKPEKQPEQNNQSQDVPLLSAEAGMKDFIDIADSAIDDINNLPDQPSSRPQTAEIVPITSAPSATVSESDEMDDGKVIDATEQFQKRRPLVERGTKVQRDRLATLAAGAAVVSAVAGLASTDPAPGEGVSTTQEGNSLEQVVEDGDELNRTLPNNPADTVFETDEHGNTSYKGGGEPAKGGPVEGDPEFGQETLKGS